MNANDKAAKAERNEDMFYRLQGIVEDAVKPPTMTLLEFQAFVRRFLPEASFSQDGDGQIIIASNVFQYPNNRYYGGVVHDMDSNQPWAPRNDI